MNKSIFLISILCFLIVKEGINQNPWKVVSSASIFQDMAAEIGRGKIDSRSIVPIGGDPHTYEPRPSDASLVASADLILVNGLNFEGWIKELIENSGTNARVVTITEGVDPITSTTYRNAYDPHAWMDASQGTIYAKNIMNALIALDPENANFFSDNGNKYISEIEALDIEIQQAVATIPKERRVLITSHDAFSYYGKRYGIEVAPVMGISTDAEAQTSDITRVSKMIQSSGVPAVFIESTINPKLLKQIAEDNNVVIGGELFSDSIGGPETEGNSYLNMLRHNTRVIVDALSRGESSKTKIDDDSTTSNSYLYLLLVVIMLIPLLVLFLKARKK